tara:strand:+ start:53 stop:1564 length:1512 start_codon:yes stop_codon:yes gene_type:complete
MAEGGTVTVDWRGDSTYYGSPNVAWSPIPIAQDLLKDHFENTNITFINNGVSGLGTNLAIDTWFADLTATASDVVVIGYGANDAKGSATNAAIDCQEYTDNLISMVTIARSLGKAVILETQPPFWDIGTHGTQDRAKRGIEFANAMRKVAEMRGVPLIDTFEYFEKVLRIQGNPALIMDDGIHPTQLGYKMLGAFKAGFFSGYAIMDDGVTSCLHPSFRHSGGYNNIAFNEGSIMGQVRIASNVFMVINVEQQGKDIYISHPRWYNGSNATNVIINGVSISNSPPMFIASTSSTHFIEAEFMIMQNANVGIYFIEISNGGNAGVGLYSVRQQQTNVTKSIATGTLIGSSWRSIGDIEMVTNATGANHYLSEIITSNNISDTSMKFEASLAGNTGIGLFGADGVDTAPAQNGVVILLNNTTGYLTASYATAGSYTGVSTIGSDDLRGVLHEYQIDCNSDGTLDIFVDGSSVGTFTPSTLYRGGRFGIYAFGTGVTVSIKNLQIK